MALTLEANYSKKLGLPNFSSHQFSVTIKTEVTDPAQVQGESTRLYGLLQTCVDREMQKTGYLPDHSKPAASAPSNGNGNGRGNGNGHGEAWACTEKQQGLILQLITEHHLDKNAVEQLALDRFGQGVKALNKLEASGLIDELIAQQGGNNPPPAPGRRPYRGGRYQRAGAR